MPEQKQPRPTFANDFVNLASPRLGGSIFEVSDEFFAPAKRMLSEEEPVFIPDLYDEHGKWMDGWESRRKRGPGHDFCTIRICPGVIRGVEIDTRYFTGNYAPALMLEVCDADIEPDGQTVWTEVIPKTDIKGDTTRFFAIDSKDTWTFARLNIYPDGGVARLRIYGEPSRVANAEERDKWVDLSSARAGGMALECNNMHFGDMKNLLSNRPVANMGDGWETRRRRDPGNDWVVLRLGQKGRICQVEVDTSFFRGNYPARCSLKGGCLESDSDLVGESTNWREILPPVALGPDQLHVLETQVRNVGDVTHVRLDIYPDGGVARLLLLGLPANSGGTT